MFAKPPFARRLEHHYRKIQHTNLANHIPCLCGNKTQRSIIPSSSSIISAHCRCLNTCDCTIGNCCSHLSHLFYTDISSRKYSRDSRLHEFISRNIAAVQLQFRVHLRIGNNPRIYKYSALCIFYNLLFSCFVICKFKFFYRFVAIYSSKAECGIISILSWVTTLSLNSCIHAVHLPHIQ